MTLPTNSSIYFHTEDINFTLKNKAKVREWITLCAEKENHTIGELNFIFCSDEYLLKINQDYLNHDTYTDIITFDYTENKIVAGDVFISIDTIKRNAKKFQVKQEDELHRVIIHGVLHLMGYKDKTPTHKALMTQKEDFCLSLR